VEAADDRDGGIEEIGHRECMELLRSQSVGRLGVVLRGRPEIFPVNYALDASGSVVLRTAMGTKLFAAVNHQVVFEIDCFDTDMRSGWSVVVHGVAQETGSVAEGDRPVVSWRADAPYLLRLASTSITGRQIRQRS
jgi:nitroimidazol reductase NimA-like FMN-containing flavoprotein (pyridoxamine 5'-phosphate oxidase superfamily)